MKRSSTKIIAVITTLATLAGQAAPAMACGGSGGGFRGSFGGGGGYGGGFAGGRIMSQPAVSYGGSSSFPTHGYSQPSYSQPVYPQPSHSQPSYSQPSVGYSGSQPMQSQYGSVPQRILSAPSQQQPMSSQAMPQSQMQQSQMPQAQVAQAGQNLRGQTFQGQAMQPNAVGTTPAQQLQAQRIDAQGNRTIAGNQLAPNTGGVTTQPTSSANNTSTSEQSALQMLASLAAPAESENQASASAMPEFSPAANNQTAISNPSVHVGTWIATLPNEASIQLQLSPDGQFSWSATQKGKSSTFAGEYTVADGRLTLVRAGDRQELKGGWTGNGNTGFNFKLDNSQDNGLDFQRQ